MMPGGGMMGWGMIWSWLIGLLLVALLIAGIVWLVTSISRSQGTRGTGSTPNQPDAMETLRQRFARGEIDREEYERARETLRQP